MELGRFVDWLSLKFGPENLGCSYIVGCRCVRVTDMASGNTEEGGVGSLPLRRLLNFQPKDGHSSEL